MQPSSNAAVVLMHMQGEPRTMQKAPTYDLVPSTSSMAWPAALRRRRRRHFGPGHRHRSCIGFGKTPDHNVRILKWLGVGHALGQPLVIGIAQELHRGPLSRASLPAALRLSPPGCRL
ncbi:MAG: hypothetical protein U1E97_03045 [Alphaproteobacteria bacterium]